MGTAHPGYPRKLRLTLPLAAIIEGQQERNRLEVLPVTPAHILTLGDLPPHHKDPSDRPPLPPKLQAVEQGAGAGLQTCNQGALACRLVEREGDLGAPASLSGGPLDRA